MIGICASVRAQKRVTTAGAGPSGIVGTAAADVASPDPPPQPATTATDNAVARRAAGASSIRDDNYVRRARQWADELAPLLAVDELVEALTIPVETDVDRRTV